MYLNPLSMLEGVIVGAVVIFTAWNIPYRYKYTPPVFIGSGVAFLVFGIFGFEYLIIGCAIFILGLLTMIIEKIWNDHRARKMGSENRVIPLREVNSVEVVNII